MNVNTEQIAFDTQSIAVLRGLNAAYDGVIIDIDRAPAGKVPAYESRAVARHAFEDSHTSLTSAHLNHAEIEQEFIGISTYLDQLDGKHVPWRQGVKDTMDVDPEAKPEATLRAEIDDAVAEVHKHADDLGVDFADPSLKDRLKAAHFKDRETVDAYLKQYAAQSRAVIAREFGIEIPDVPSEVVTNDGKWAGYMFTDENGQWVRQFNDKRASKGQIAAYVDHEDNHLGFFSLQERAVAAGRMSTRLLVKVPTTAQYTQAETNAQFAEFYMPDEADEYARFAFTENSLLTKVWHLGQVMVNNGAYVREAVEFAQPLVPSQDTADLTEAFTSRLSDPLFRFYFGGYESALGITAPLKALPRDRQRQAFTQLMHGLQTPEAMTDIVTNA